MQVLIKQCKGDCGQETVIVNKHYGLCDDCNYKRLHGGQSKSQVYQSRAIQRAIDKPKVNPTITHDNRQVVVAELKSKYSIKKISNKKAERDKRMHVTYAKIDQNRPPICEGCGRGDLPLSHSHLLSQHDRPDLADAEQNIRLHCFGSYAACHETWERGVPYQVVEMDDFAANVQYISTVDKQKYNAIVASFEFYGVPFNFKSKTDENAKMVSRVYI